MEKDFAEKLRTLRRQKNLTQAELGKLIGIHYNHIGRYERGQAKPSAETLYKIANVLDVSGDYLLGKSSSEATPNQALFKDEELFQIFQKSQNLPNKDLEVIKTLIEAFLFKKEIQDKFISH
jgi:transcriptional regulator with XRE-family HTH domain